MEEQDSLLLGNDVEKTSVEKSSGVFSSQERDDKSPPAPPLDVNLAVADLLFPRHRLLDEQNRTLFMWMLQRARPSEKSIYVGFDVWQCSRDFIQKTVLRQRKVAGKLTRRASPKKLMKQMIAIDEEHARDFKLFNYSVKEGSRRSFYLGIDKIKLSKALWKVGQRALREKRQLVKEQSFEPVFQGDHEFTEEDFTLLLKNDLRSDAKKILGRQLYHSTRHGCAVHKIQSLSAAAQRLLFRGRFINADIELAHLSLIQQDLLLQAGPKSPAGCPLSSVVGSASPNTTSPGLNCGNPDHPDLRKEMEHAVRSAQRMFGQAGKTLVKEAVLSAINGSFSPSKKLNGMIARSFEPEQRKQAMASWRTMLKPLFQAIKSWQASLNYTKGMAYTNALGKVRLCHKMGHVTSSNLQARIEVVVRAAAAHIRSQGGKVAVHMIDGLVLDCSMEVFSQTSAYVLRTFGLNMREKEV